METYSPEMKKLMLERLEKRNQQGRLHGVYQLGKYYSPDQIVTEAKKGTAIGDEFLLAEKRLMDEMKKRM